MNLHKPHNPNFSSGPCPKRPNWDGKYIHTALLGRSHRSKPAKMQLKQLIDQIKLTLELPSDFQVGIVPASDTGAFEMAMWNFLGHIPVDVYAWESFGKGWVTDIIKQLNLEDANVIEADYGILPDLQSANSDCDIVFTLNGTTSGVRVPDLNWIKDSRKGLTLCDATSGLFAQKVDWSKLDVTTFSWQKVLGGEAQHGMIILSPKAIDRLNEYSPNWPLPKIFRIKKSGTVDESIFSGSTINTPSLLCVADYVAALEWAREIGGLDKLIGIADNNLNIIKDWVKRTDWINFLAKEESTISNTSVCLEFSSKTPNGNKIDTSKLSKLVQNMLEEEGVALDIGAYRDAPAGLRIWTGATIEPADISILLEWINWAYCIAIEKV